MRERPPPFAAVIPAAYRRHSSRSVPVIPAKAGIQKSANSDGRTENGGASLSESGFIGLAGFSGFRFARLALFAATGNSANPSADKHPPSRQIRAPGES